VTTQAPEPPAAPVAPAAAAAPTKDPVQFTAPWREYAALILVFADAAFLFIALIHLIVGLAMDSPGGFAGEANGAFDSFVNLVTVIFPLGGVLLATHIKPVLARSKMLCQISLIEYGVGGLLGLMCLLVGFFYRVTQNDNGALYDAFMDLISRLIWLLIFVFAAFLVLRIYQGAFYVRVPKPVAYPQPGYGYPQPGYGGYPQQPGYPQQQGYPQPGYPPQTGYAQHPGAPAPQGYPPAGYQDPNAYAQPPAQVQQQGYPQPQAQYPVPPANPAWQPPAAPPPPTSAPPAPVAPASAPPASGPPAPAAPAVTEPTSAPPSGPYASYTEPNPGQPVGPEATTVLPPPPPVDDDSNSRTQAIPPPKSEPENPNPWG
jgi:hypothetical protein